MEGTDNGVKTGFQQRTVFEHMRFNTCFILKEADVAELVQLIKTDGLHCDFCFQGGPYWSCCIRLRRRLAPEKEILEVEQNMTTISSLPTFLHSSIRLSRWG